MRRNVTFDHFVNDIWLPNLQQTHSLATTRAYKNIIHRYGRSLEHKQVCSITTQDIASLLNNIRCGNNLSPKSLSAIECAFNSVFRLACEKGIIAKNPMKALARQSPRPLPFTPYTDDQLRRIESCIPYLHGTNVFGAAMHSDLRRSELLGISTKDFQENISHNMVKIPYLVLEDGQLGSMVVPNPKQDQYREISDKAVAYLENEYHRLGAKLAQSGLNNRAGLLFVGRNGCSIPLLELGRSSRAIRNMAAIPNFSLSNLRRTYRLRCRCSEVL